MKNTTVNMSISKKEKRGKKGHRNDMMSVSHLQPLQYSPAHFLQL